MSELAREFDPYAASGEINSSVDGIVAKVADVRASYTNDAVIDDLDGLSVTARPGTGGSTCGLPTRRNCSD